MSAHISDNVQIIEKNGQPMFAVIPYEDYLNLLPEDIEVTIPHQVVGLVVKKGMNLVKSWRKVLCLTQAELLAAAERNLPNIDESLIFLHEEQMGSSPLRDFTSLRALSSSRIRFSFSSSIFLRSRISLNIPIM